MLVTEFGIVIVVRPHPQKAEIPMSVTELGMVIDSKLEHCQKAASPILVTDSGMVTDVKLVQ